MTQFSGGDLQSWVSSIPDLNTFMEVIRCLFSMYLSYQKQNLEGYRERYIHDERYGYFNAIIYVCLLVVVFLKIALSSEFSSLPSWSAGSTYLLWKN